MIFSMETVVKFSLFVLVSIGAFFSGCTEHRQISSSKELTAYIGKQVEIEGVTEDRKIGPALCCNDVVIWVDGLEKWPAECERRHVRVTGILEEHYDLPVFIQRANEDPIQGIPVPEGTDLHEASRRWVVRDARWIVVQ